MRARSTAFSRSRASLLAASRPDDAVMLTLATFRATSPASSMATTPIHSLLRVTLTIRPESASSPTATAVRPTATGMS